MILGERIWVILFHFSLNVSSVCDKRQIFVSRTWIGPGFMHLYSSMSTCPTQAWQQSKWLQTLQTTPAVWFKKAKISANVSSAAQWQFVWFCSDSGWYTSLETDKHWWGVHTKMEVKLRRRSQESWKRAENEHFKSRFSSFILQKLRRGRRLTTLSSEATWHQQLTRIVLHRLKLHLHSAPVHSHTAARKRSSSLCGAALIQKNRNSYSSAHKQPADWR